MRKVSRGECQGLALVVERRRSQSLEDKKRVRWDVEVPQVE